MRSLEWCYVDELELGDHVCDLTTEDQPEVEVVALDLVRVPSGECEWLVSTTGPTIRCPVLDRLPRRSPRKRAWRHYLLERPHRWFGLRSRFESTTARLRQSVAARSRHVRRRVPFRSRTDSPREHRGQVRDMTPLPRVLPINAPEQPDAPSPAFPATLYGNSATEQGPVLDPADAKALGIALVRASVEGQAVRLMLPPD